MKKTPAPQVTQLVGDARANVALQVVQTVALVHAAQFVTPALQVPQAAEVLTKNWPAPQVTQLAGDARANVALQVVQTVGLVHTAQLVPHVPQG